MRVAVLGAGFAGLGSCAALAADGHQVVLLERRGLFGGRFACSRDAVTGDPVGAAPVPATTGSTELLALLESLGLRDALHAPAALALPCESDSAARRLLGVGDATPLLWPRRPWGELAEDLGARLAQRGATLRRRALVEAIEIEAGRVVAVRSLQRPASREEIRRGRRGERERLEVDGVIATPGWPALAPLLPASVRSAEAFRRAEALRPVAAETVHLWYAEAWPGRSLHVVGDGSVAFAIDASRLYGRASELHQVTVAIDPAAAATSRTPGEWTAAAAAALTTALPALEARPVARVIALRDPAAAFASEGERPSQATPLRGLALAGDWTATGLPPSIEAAVASGRRAATLVSRG